MTTLGKVSVAAGVSTGVFGAVAFFAPETFFDSAAYPPYSEHWIRDVGSFMLGLAAVLVLAGFTASALTVAFGGNAFGGWFHFVSHLMDRSSSVNGTRDAVVMGIFAVVFTGLAVASRRAEPTD